MSDLRQLSPKTLFIGKQFWFYPLLDSTSEQLRRLLRGENAPTYYNSSLTTWLGQNQDLPEGSLVLADFQTRGHGQRGSSWHSEPGLNLLFSFLLRPRLLPPDRQFCLNQAVSLAIYDSIASLFGPGEIHIKWPNDLIARGNKLAGILIENSLSSNKMRHSIIGVGLNVHQLSFPKEVPHVTSLQREGVEVQRRPLLENILESVERRYLQLLQSHFEELRKDYLAALFRFDEWALYRLREGELFEGRFVDVLKSGQLLMEYRDGRQRAFAFKEVAFVY